MTNAIVATAGTVFAAAAFAVAGAPLAIGDTGTAQSLGSSGTLREGETVQAWTVTGLRPSSDSIPYTPQGQLWEATATDEAVKGSVVPIVANFNARSAAGENYRVLFGVATAQGVNPSTLVEGQKTSGKVYFDVTGGSPTTVVYADSARDLLVWTVPPPESSAGYGSSSSAGASRQQPGARDRTASGADGERVSDGEESADAEGPQGEGRQGVPLKPAEGESGGRQGTTIKPTAPPAGSSAPSHGTAAAPPGERQGVPRPNTAS